MSVVTCATAASANHVQAFRDVCSWFFDAIATAKISDTKAMNIRGASRKTKKFGWSSMVAQIAISTKDGADNFHAVALPIT